MDIAKLGLLTTLLLGIFILIGLGSKIAPSIAEMSNMPFYIFLGGVIGVMVVYTSNVVIPKIPVVYSTLLMFSGQMLCAIIIDAIVMKDFSILKLIGAIIVVLGILYNSRVDAKENKIENQSLKEVENIN